MTRRRSAATAALVLLAGCGSGAGSPAPAPPGPAAARVGSVDLRVELASTDAQREQGLRGRGQVPPGTGMAFPYDAPRPVRFTMAGVALPLVAVFARDGRALSVEQLRPCAGSVAQCPLYGPPDPVDLVIEAAPGTLAGVRVGDSVTLEAPGR